MRTPRLTRLAGTTALLLTLAACAGPSSTQSAQDPADDGDPGAGDALPAVAEEAPTAIPPAAGRVGTRPPGVATVVGRDGDVVICLGPVAESAPPQCDGIPVSGWSWQRAGMFAEVAGGRFGDYAVAGTFDGTTLAVDDVVPVALYSPMSSEPEPLPQPGTAYSDAELRTIARDLRRLPGYLTSALVEGHVTVSVVHDDGTLQAWADRNYGVDVVLVEGALVALDTAPGAVSGDAGPTAGPPPRG